MIKPTALQAGDVVGVVAPSDAVESRDILAGVRILEEWGLKVKVGKHVYARVGDFAAGTPAERMEDLREMIADPEVKVIWAAGGGYAATEIMPVFSKDVLEKLALNFKWFIGYSDICLILNGLTSFRMVSVVGPNLGGLSEWDKRSQDMMRQILFGEPVAGIGADAKWKAELPGTAVGKLLVSNLETLIFSFGTRFDPLMYGSGDVILGFEELDIDKSALQRQIDIVFNHKRAKRIAGVFVGRLVNIREVSYPEWGKKVTAEGLVVDRGKRFGVPLAFLNDFGHPEWTGAGALVKYPFANKRFVPIPNGIEARLTVGEKECKLDYLEPICAAHAQPTPAGLI